MKCEVVFSYLKDEAVLLFGLGLDQGGGHRGSWLQDLHISVADLLQPRYALMLVTPHHKVKEGRDHLI